MNRTEPISPWSENSERIFALFQTSENGLSSAEAKKRLAADGPNEIEKEKSVAAWIIFLRQFTSPLVLILLFASIISFVLGEQTETILIIVMVLISGMLAFIQEYRSERSLRSLRKKLTRYAYVIRNGKQIRINATETVKGDMVRLEPGSVVPADLRMIEVEGLEIDESMITGESVPVPKTTKTLRSTADLPHEQVNMAFLGTPVVQGSGTGIVVRTGMQTEMGRTASLLTEKPEETQYQQGIRKFGGFLVKITVGLAFIVAVSLGLLRGEWGESLLFALALAVGISPELLPVIITINLSRGAMKMSKKQVMIKRLIGIEDLGDADVFCTDKTGTLTVGKLRVRGSIDPDGHDNNLALELSAFCTDTRTLGKDSNPIDQAISEAAINLSKGPAVKGAESLQIIPFDFERRRVGCVIQLPDKTKHLIIKGAVKETLKVCTHRIRNNTESISLTSDERRRLLKQADELHDKGYRLLATARRSIADKTNYSPKDERGMELVGFVLVSDAPKQTAKAALKALEQLHVRIVILTGDNERVTAHVASQIGFKITNLLTGDQINQMDEAQLNKTADETNVFARITPEQKMRVLKALKHNGHAVGFMGDGINDAPALRLSDVGISFEDATEVAKEAADIILLKKNLSVLADGIKEGRRTFVNTHTYINATMASNFGNMISVAGSSFLLPFLPLLPAQIILLNLLSDGPMLAVSGDRVSDWDVKEFANKMYFFGIISSLADFAIFALMLYALRTNIVLFRSGWFLESMLTEVAVIFLLRTRRHLFSNRPGTSVIIASGVTLVITLLLLQTPISALFELVPLQGLIITVIIGIVLGYALLTELGKRIYYRYIDKT